MTDYTPSGDPLTGSRGLSSLIRSEFDSISTAVNSKGDKLALSSTSSTSMTIADTTQTFVIETGKEFLPGMTIFLSDVAAPSTNYMVGMLISYSSTTGLASASITSHGGSGTKSSWYVGLSTSSGVTLSNNTFLGHQNFARAIVASAATTSDIWGALGNQIDFTGTATVTDFPAAQQAGVSRELICAGACSFTAGANMLIDGVSSGNTLACEANDIVIVRAVSTTQFRLTRFSYLGKPISDVRKNSFLCLTGNGYGSTDTCIRRLTTTTYNNGTAFTIAHSATNGTTITVNETGLYMFVAYDRKGAGLIAFGLSINATGADLTTAATSLARTKLMAGCHTANTNATATYSVDRLCVIDKLSAGDIVRLHGDGAVADPTYTLISGIKLYDL